MIKTVNGRNAMDDQKGYWFKRRRYGWGWTPVSWQGWASLATFLLLVTVSAVVLVVDEPSNTISQDGLVFIASVVLLALCLMVVTLAKGPEPRWRWGRSVSDNPDEDY